MSKLAGNVQRHLPTSTMFDLVQKMADTLANIGDKRFDRFWNYVPIPAVIPWFQNSKRVNVLAGANKSTKSFTSVFKAIMVYTGIVPPSMQGVWNHAPLLMALNRPRHVRIIVSDYSKHFPETILPILLSEEWGMLPEAWASNYDPDEHMFYGPDGSFLSIMAIDPKKQVDPNTLRGPMIDHTYIDELQQRMVYTESLARNATLSDGPRTVDLGYCPQEGYDWTYDDLYLSGYNRENDQPLPPEKCSQDINVLRVTMRDNPSITQEALDSYIRTLKPWEIAYRVEGRYTVRAGDPYFDMYQLMEWERQGLQKDGVPYKIEHINVDADEGEFDGHLEKLDYEPHDEDDIWRVWELPKHGEYYLMTIDTAEGHIKSNYQVADIWRCSEEGKINVDRPRQVAQFRKRTIKPGDFIVESCLMANIYGGILLCYEVNNTAGGTVRDRSRNYQNLYKRLGPGKKEVEDETEYIGWWTDKWNKPTAIEEVYHMLQEWKVSGYCGINSPHTLSELMSFEEQIKRDEETGIAVRTFAAKQGAFDDCISVLFQMAYILRFQNTILTPAEISVKSATEKYKSPLEEESARLQRKKLGTRLRKQPSLTTIAKGHHGGRNDEASSAGRVPGHGRFRSQSPTAS